MQTFKEFFEAWNQRTVWTPSAVRARSGSSQPISTGSGNGQYEGEEKAEQLLQMVANHFNISRMDILTKYSILPRWIWIALSFKYSKNWQKCICC